MGGKGRLKRPRRRVNDMHVAYNHVRKWTPVDVHFVLSEIC